jgi:hypothetical protein
MDIDAIHGFRAAAFLNGLRTPIHPDWLRQASELEDESVEDIIGALSRSVVLLIRANSDYGVPGPLEKYDLVWQKMADEYKVPFSSHFHAYAADLLLFYDTIRLVGNDEEFGYFGTGASAQILKQIREKFPELVLFLDAIEIEQSNNGILLSADEKLFQRKARASGGAGEILTEWSETLTPAFSNCVRLLLFEGAYTWDTELQKLRGLERELVNNPALQMSDMEVDDISWGLVGAEPFFPPGVTPPNDVVGLGAYERRPAAIDWTVTYSLVEKLRAEEGDRLSQLRDVRGAIAEAAKRLTTNEVAAATQRLVNLARGPVYGG